MCKSRSDFQAENLGIEQRETCVPLLLVSVTLEACHWILQQVKLAPVCLDFDPR